MPDSTITTIRKALADQIKAAIEVDGRDINVSWFPGSGSPPPVIEVDESDDTSIDYKSTLKRGPATLNFTLTVTMDSRSPEALTKAMDDLLSWDSDNSVYAAVWSDITLGGTVEEAFVLTARRFADLPSRAEIPIEITVSKS